MQSLATPELMKSHCVAAKCVALKRPSVLFANTFRIKYGDPSRFQRVLIKRLDEQLELL
jgi:hypothetical protein